MKRQTMTILACALLLAGCSAPKEDSASSRSNPSTSISSSAESRTASSASSMHETSQGASHNSENEDSSKSSGSENTSTPSHEENQTPAPEAASSEPTAFQSEIEGKLYQALSDNGFTNIVSRWQMADTGNRECILTFNGMNDPGAIWLTFFTPSTSPRQTFESNTTLDRTRNMDVQNEWTDNGNTVRVIHNNRAEANFIEVLDEKQELTLHCSNTVSDQLQPMLKVLQALGFPVQYDQ